MFCRKTLVFTSAVSLLVLGSLRAAEAPNQPWQNVPASEPLATKQVRGNLYQVSGGVANTFFYVGPDEVLVVDAKMTPDAARQMLAEVKKVTDKPVRRVILTHSDGDHVNGLAGLMPVPTIISHANSRLHMAQANATASNKLPLPNETFSQQLSLYLGDTEIRVLYFGPAHTNGDAVIFIPSEKLAIVGDLVFVGRDPLIHRQKGGSSVGLVALLKSLLQLDADLYLSGHAEAVDKQAIERLLTEIEQKQAKVKTLVAEGKTFSEVKEAFGLTDQPAGGRRWPSLVEVIYRELTEKN
ncbi:MAG: MBL fold metallo-hydrolase [Planctomycetota bacterium]|nr:MBL fold metallo-hydrolase [Planctomycetota bacterium]